MDREYTNVRKIINSYIEDDGWKPPKEILEVITLRVETAYKNAYIEIIKQHNAHKGEYINHNVVKNYEMMALVIRLQYGNQYVGRMRELGEELQRIYGVTELEAINILNGKNTDDYINKYFRMEHLIPAHIDAQGIFDNTLSSYGYAVNM